MTRLTVTDNGVYGPGCALGCLVGGVLSLLLWGVVICMVAMVME